MERLSAPLPLETKAVDEAGVFTGLASAFGNVDSYGDIVAQGAFAKSLAERWPVMLFAHDQATPLGRWLECREDAVGLRVKGALDLNVARAREVHSLIKGKAIGGLSIGYRVPPGGSEYGRDGLTILKQVELLEVSIVSLAANARAQIEAVKSFGSRAELEEILREARLPSRAVQKLLRGGWREFAGEDEEDSKKLERLAAAISAASQRLKGL